VSRGLWISIKIGNSHAWWLTISAIAGVLLLNAVCVLGYQKLYKDAVGPLELAIRRYFGIAMRFNALLIGAVGLEMILPGIREYYFPVV